MVRPCSLVLVVSLFACGPEAAPAPAPAPQATPPAAPEAKKAEPVTPVDAPKVDPAPVVPDTGPLGVAGCDEYIAAYRACIAGLPADAREGHTKVVDGQRAAWGKAKADAKAATSLPDACTAARAAAKVSLPDCKW